MSRRDVREASEAAMEQGAGGARVRNVGAAQQVLTAAGETLSRGEIREMLEFFREQAGNSNNDAETVTFMQETVQTITHLLEEVIPQINGIVEEEAPTIKEAFETIIGDAPDAPTLTQYVGQQLGLEIPEYMQHTPAATKAHLKKAMENGATYYDLRLVEAERLAVDHGHITHKGVFQRYPQGHELGGVLKLSEVMDSLDGLDPRATILQGDALKAMTTGNPEHTVFSRSGSEVTLTPSTEPWNGRLTEEYDELGHADHLAWSRNSPFASNYLIWLDGSIHALRAPRRSKHQDNLGMGGGILTTGSLGRGWPAFWHGHIHGVVRNGTFYATDIGLSGRLCRQVAEGEITLPHPMPLVQAQGIALDSGARIWFENSRYIDDILVDEARGIVTRR